MRTAITSFDLGRAPSGADMDEQESATGRQVEDRVLEAVRAVVRGDARAPDVARQLDDAGLGALDVLLALVAQAGRGAGGARGVETLDPFRLAAAVEPPGPPGPVRARLPVLFEGTLYDPEDLSRLDGRPLHLIASEVDHFLATTDRGVMASLWTSIFWTAAEDHRYGGMRPSTPPGPLPAPSGPGGQVPPLGSGASTRGGHTWFRSDVNDSGGERWSLARNRGCPDLTEVGYGFLGTSDWNDRISEIGLYGTHVCVLFEHIHYAGASFTVLFGRGPGELDAGSSPADLGPVRLDQWRADLRLSGFDNRASSVQTW